MQLPRIENYHADAKEIAHHPGLQIDIPDSPLTLRKFTSDDTIAYYNLIKNNRDFLIKYSSDYNLGHRYPAQTEMAIEDTSGGTKLRLGLWHEEKEKESLIGAITVTLNYNCTAEIGYLISEHMTRHGYMKKTVTELVEFLRDFIGVWRIIAWIREDNMPSQALAESAGFFNEEKVNWGTHEYFRYVFATDIVPANHHSTSL